MIEYKLLLGDELAPGWHWGSNLVLEHETGGERENDYEGTLGLSHTLVDERFSLGGELKVEFADTAEDRGDFDKALELGPSLQYRPFHSMHIDVAPLVGIGADARALDVYVVLGWEF